MQSKGDPIYTKNGYLNFNELLGLQLDQHDEFSNVRKIINDQNAYNGSHIYARPKANDLQTIR